MSDHLLGLILLPLLEHNPKTMALFPDDYNSGQSANTPRKVILPAPAEIPPFKPKRHETVGPTPTRPVRALSITPRDLEETEAKIAAAKRRRSEIAKRLSESSHYSLPPPSQEVGCRPESHYQRDSVMGISSHSDYPSTFPYDFEPFSNPRPAPSPPNRSYGHARGSSSSSVEWGNIPSTPTESSWSEYTASSQPSTKPSSIASIPSRAGTILRKSKVTFDTALPHLDHSKRDSSNRIKSWRYEDFTAPESPAHEHTPKNTNPFKGIFHKKKTSISGPILHPGPGISFKIV